MIVPTLRYERRLWQEGAVRVVGVDEVGVAPTCGAVVAAAVIIRPNARKVPGVRDSKTLSALQRERLVGLVRAKAVAVGVGAASVREIDRLNIYHATHLAMRRAIARIGEHDHVLVDGRRIVGFEAEVGPYTAIVDGDALCYSIACASIVAKVTRDRMMSRLAARYPEYGWQHNQGYSSREHRRALFEHGVTPHHRRSFLTVQAALAGRQEAFDLFGEAAAGSGATGSEDEDVDGEAPVSASTGDGDAGSELDLAALAGDPDAREPSADELVALVGEPG
ncbi:MAG TPA: ribonuclease HII [Candidatus Limnocylindrales bacterium]|nr:ribonuclease HII [Candidatus Limnocylindrales bacterium]